MSDPNTNPNPLAAKPDAGQFVQGMTKHEILTKYKSIGEKHPKIQQLRQALETGKPADVEKLLPDLEAILKSQKPAREPGSYNFPIWNFLWVTVISFSLAGLLLHLFNQQVRLLKQAAQKGPAVELIGSPRLGGEPSESYSEQLVLDISHLKPDNILFVGHRLIKKEVVEYLSAISKSTNVKILLGDNYDGKNLLDDIQSPLRQLYFTDIEAVKYPINTQVLIVLNTQTKQAFAIIGTYPFDKTEAEKQNPEYSMVKTTDYDTCVKLYSTYVTLFPHQ